MKNYAPPRMKPAGSGLEGFIVRLRHKNRPTVEYLASPNGPSVSDRTDDPKCAWVFPTAALARSAAYLSLGLHSRDFMIDALPTKGR